MANIFLKSFTCPHCSTKCSFYGEGIHDTVTLWCTGCGQGVYFKLEGYEIPEKYNQAIHIDPPERIIDYYPKRAISTDGSITKEVADDFIEASKCLDVGAPKATVAMCRRTLQSTCETAGANPKDDLVNQIDDLESRRVINTGLKNIAHTIRVIGNWGAHPQQDLLKGVTLDDALEVLKFTDEFLDEVFVRPARLTALRTKKGLK